MQGAVDVPFHGAALGYREVKDLRNSIRALFLREAILRRECDDFESLPCVGRRIRDEFRCRFLDHCPWLVQPRCKVSGMGSNWFVLRIRKLRFRPRRPRPWSIWSLATGGRLVAGYFVLSSWLSVRARKYRVHGHCFEAGFDSEPWQGQRPHRGQSLIERITSCCHESLPGYS
jgi:hypothetical protein